MMELFGGRKDTPAPPAIPTQGAPDSGPDEAPKSSLFSRMKQTVARTRESLSTQIESHVALTRTVDESTLESLESGLLTSDLGVQATSLVW